MEGSLVRFYLLNLIVDNKGLERLGGGGGTVQGLVADDWDGRRLVRQRLGDRERVQRRGSDAPRVAKDVFSLAVKVRELGRVGLGSEDGEGRLRNVSLPE